MLARSDKRRLVHSRLDTTLRNGSRFRFTLPALREDEENDD
jgi:hypothetical protein